jgi:hypothetical protein
LPRNDEKTPLLFLDVDGVISLFGFPSNHPPPGTFHWVDGVMHCIDITAGEKANEYLPHLLNLHVAELPVLTFDGRARFGSSHWKIDAIDEYARGRAAAWVDDFIDSECEAWAGFRREPTMLVLTESHTGLTDELVEKLIRWAESLAGPADR